MINWTVVNIFIPIPLNHLTCFNQVRTWIWNVILKWSVITVSKILLLYHLQEDFTDASVQTVLNWYNLVNGPLIPVIIWTASSEFGTYSLCEQQRFRRACAFAQSRQNLRCSLIQAVSQEEPSDRKPDPWPLWMAGHAQLNFVMTECSKTQISLTGLIWCTILTLRE